MNKEYVVWGVPPNESDEQPLFTKAATMEEAQDVAQTLRIKYGCTSLRVQVIDLDECPSKLWLGL